MSEMNDVVAKLAKLTEQRQVPWKTTVDKSTFAATFGRMSVLISAKDTRPGSDIRSYRLSVLDEKGNEIDFATAADFDLVTGEMRLAGPRDVPALVPLYTSAQRAALDVDRRLEELLNEMDRVSNS
jgi:hypothetical protein